MKLQGGYLIDTNVISESVKERSSSGVRRFFDKTKSSRMYISVMTLGELRKGASLRRKQDAQMGEKLRAWIQEVENEYRDRILPINVEVANLWAEFVSNVRTRPIVDSLIAATAAANNLVLVTRNIQDVEDLPISVINPWDL